MRLRERAVLPSEAPAAENGLTSDIVPRVPVGAEAFTAPNTEEHAWHSYQPPTSEDALAKRRSNRSFAAASPSDRELERILNGNDLVDEFYLERALVAAQPIARVTVRNAAGHERRC